MVGHGAIEKRGEASGLGQAAPLRLVHRWVIGRELAGKFLRHAIDTARLMFLKRAAARNAAKEDKRNAERASERAKAPPRRGPRPGETNQQWIDRELAERDAARPRDGPEESGE